MKRQKLKKYISNKLGMTYVELLCALALLTLIVMAFTPMLLSSYETIYVAGERTEEVYNAQQELEQGLATRYSEIGSGTFSINFRHNAEALFQNLNVRGRKVVSTLQDKFETVFHGARTRIDIISSDVVYDDTSTHEVILQTTGLVYDKVTLGTYSGNKEDMPENQIHIEVYVPDKDYSVTDGTTTYELAYHTPSNASVLNSFDTHKGRIIFTVGGADFTQSPLMIKVYYKNERGILKTLTDYLYIEPARLMLAGTTRNADYYTSAGVQEVDVSTDSQNKVSEFRLDVEARTMRLENSGFMNSSDSPKSKGVTIKTISWVPNDTNESLHPYYVMAGTNGSVYRMYNMTNQKSLQAAMGSSNSVAGSPDGSLILDDGTYVYPSFWSGEMSDQYYYRTQEIGNGYGATADNTKDCSSGTKYNHIGKTLNYAMMFSGFNTGYAYAHQANRRISYILTEVGNKSFRLGGKKGAVEDYAGYTAFWEPEYTTYVGHSKIFGFYTQFNTEAENTVYLYNDSGIGDVAASNAHYDKNLAYLRLKSYTSINPFAFSTSSAEYVNAWNKGDFWFPTNTDDESGLGSCGPNTEYSWLDTYGNTATITASVYLPGSSSTGEGQVIYFGSTPAYAFLRQSSDIGTTDNATKIYNNNKIKDSRATAYVILGNADKGATLYKGYGVNDNDTKPVSNKLRDAGYNSATPSTGDTYAFYTVCIDQVYKYEEKELMFTLGYCSRWRMAMGDVTHNGRTEESRSYEKYYITSHAGEGYTRVPGTLNGGGENNLYYNVWFPGEFYNLTVADTCDEVTVAVGYTVSGSSYMKETAVEGVTGNGYYGTALGSIYNDGVLAAYTSSDEYRYTVSGKGEQTTIFKNLLYYKSETFVNATLHSRKNIRFVAVGVNSETTKTTDSSATKKYYAYYGDNYGNVYRSLVATASVSYNASSEYGGSETTTLVSYIADPVSNSGAPSTMEPITVNGSPMSAFFAEIVSIEAEEDIIIITGTPTSTAYNIVVVGTKDSSGNWSWKTVNLGGYMGEIITSSYVVGGYYYVGVTDGTNCWIGAVNLETLKAASNGHTLPPAYKKSSTKDVFLYNDIGDKIYAIAGRETV